MPKAKSKTKQRSENSILWPQWSLMQFINEPVSGGEVKKAADIAGENTDENIDDNAGEKAVQNIAGVYSGLMRAGLEFSELCAQRNRAYMELPRQMRDCNRPEDLAKVEAEFWQMAYEQYKDYSAHSLPGPLAVLGGVLEGQAHNDVALELLKTPTNGSKPSSQRKPKRAGSKTSVKSKSRSTTKSVTKSATRSPTRSPTKSATRLPTKLGGKPKRTVARKAGTSTATPRSEASKRGRIFSVPEYVSGAHENRGRVH